MVRQTTTLVVLMAALSSAACSVHISTGPSTPRYTSSQPHANGIVWTTAPRPPREHRDHTPREQADRETPKSDRDTTERQRPNRQFDAADELAADAAGQRIPRQLEPTKDREVVTVATPSHTGRKRPRDTGHWVNKPVDGHRPDGGPQLAGGGGEGNDSDRKSLQRGDGRLQRVAKQ